ncbi:hypothetical protein KMW28_18075 [Flammeovirga yaeyamensis]|uniref:ABC transporter permease n=1 Tax=Flammeovirga yaeyamensis TaxID=367791 RepID=A0AAX1N2M4_9BACT|nr:DUF5687 family protein [Flammeovirga yaeyamensis]MBB3698067.1 hypothetical protein [Flammeovirga yaeyamensis]NMF34574.1 hypothetical protein [Flammeovirga yaeyamensis]QWG01551.1 hypothetical protein KMW28_18075 [Flammeovirga yaeyamensis]
MILKLTSLYLKGKGRSVFDAQSVLIKFFVVLMVLYFGGAAVSLSFFLDNIMLKYDETQVATLTLSKFLYYYFVLDLFLRSVIQNQSPFDVKPYLYLPIKRSSLLHFLQVKSLFSAFNVLPYFLFLPFFFIAVINDVDGIQALVWLISITLHVLINNFLAYNIGKTVGKAFIPWLIITLSILGLGYIDIKGYLPLSTYFAEYFNMVVTSTWMVIIPILLFMGIYFITLNLSKTLLLTDQEIHKEKVSSFDLSYLIKGDSIMKSFMIYESKLILRNKRLKNLVVMVFLFLFYPMIVVKTQEHQAQVMLFFFCWFTTGVVGAMFGQFMYAWEGKFFNFIRTQPFTVEDYIKAKHNFYLGITTISMILGCSIFAFLDLNFALMIFVGYLFNIGINLKLIFFIGTFNKKAIELDKGTAFNYQGTQASHFISNLPLMIIPLVLYAIGYYAFDHYTALIIVSSVGILGLVFHSFMIKPLVNQFNKRKYRMSEGFSQ